MIPVRTKVASLNICHDVDQLLEALEVLDASKVSMFLYLEPVTTLVAAILLLHEKIFFISILGGVIIIIGVVIVNGQMISIFHQYLWR